MLEGLLGFDKDMKMLPLLAESYEASEDAKEFTFHLRTGIKFHDGTPFNAQAVKVNFERVANPGNHLKRQSLLAMLDHAEVVDEYTAKMRAEDPFGAFITDVAHPSLQLLSPAAIQKYGKEVGAQSGRHRPVQFVSWSADTLKVAKIDHYWQPGLPKRRTTVTVRSAPENGARIAMLQAGEAQFIYPVPPQMMKLVRTSPKLDVINDPSIFVRYVAMNVMQEAVQRPAGAPGAELRDRQARLRQGRVQRLRRAAAVGASRRR